MNGRILSSIYYVLSIILGSGDTGKQNLCSHKHDLLIIKGRQVSKYINYLGLRWWLVLRREKIYEATSGGCRQLKLLYHGLYEAEW